MADLFWSYWDASVRFGLLALVLLAVTPFLKRWISPKLLCWAWALLILRLALPLALPFSGSIFNLSESLQPSTWTEVLRNGVVDAGWGETILPKLRTDEEKVISDLVGFSWEKALVLVWVCGMLFLFARLVFNAFRLRRFFNRAERRDSGRLHEIFKQTRQRFGIYANVPLLVSSDVKTPGIAGIYNPRIVLPRVCAKELSDSELRCVFLHELTHYRRGDLFLHHLLLLICFVHWYNPLVWLVFREFKNSMEQACDADVVESECLETVQQYGFTLLQVMQRSRVRFASPAGALCLLGNRRSSALKERIHLIASPRRRNPILLALGLGVFGLSFVYAITGEQVVEREAERLLRLTRFSGPILFIAHSSADNYDEQLRRQMAYNTTEVASPQSWVQEVNVAEHQGKEVTVRLSYSATDPQERQLFWMNVLNRDGLVIASSSLSPPGNKETSFRMIEVPITLTKNAHAIVYGLSSSGDGGLWVDSLEMTADQSLLAGR